MQKQDWKKALISIMIGAAVMALNTFLQGLLDFIKSHSSQIVPAAISLVHYLIPQNNA